MSISLVGSGASSIWQLLNGNSSTSSGTSSAFDLSNLDNSTSSKSGTSGTSTTSAASTLSAANAKVVSDLNSLLLDLQSDSSTSTTGASSTAASTGSSTTGSSTTGSTSASDSSGSSDISADLVKDLKGMFGEFRKAGQHQHDVQDASGGSSGNGSSSSTDPFAQMTSALSAYAQQLGLNSSSTAAKTSTSLSA